MLKTSFLDLFETKYPIIQAGMGPYDTTEIAAAVAKVGGLGLISTVGMGSFELPGLGKFNYSRIFGEGSPSELLEQSINRVLEKIQDIPSARFGVNIPVSEEFIPTAAELIHYLIGRLKTDEECAQKLKIIVTSAGDPLPWASDPQDKKIPESISIKDELPNVKWLHVVPSVRAAKRCEKADVDAIVASGREGGAHCSWRDTSSMVLIPEVIQSVKKPVIAAGGFCDGRSLAAALALGAIGIQMGTRFIATQESEFEAQWKQMVVQATEEDAVVARGFFGPMRFLRNKCGLKLVDATVRGASDLYKGIPTGSTQEIIDLEIKGLDNLFEKGDAMNSPILGGTVAGRIHEIPSVTELIPQIVEDAEKIVKNLSKCLQ